MNSFLKWSDAYTVGNDLLDRQHKKLLEIAGEATEVFAAPYVASADFYGLLNEFAEKQWEHFRAEEKILARNCYPNLAAHMAEHDGFRSTLANLLTDAGNGAVHRKALLTLMADFTTNHMLTTDMGCKAYLKVR